MNKTRTEIKVGLFVMVGLFLAALTIIQFNKSAGPLTKIYNLHLTATNSAGVIPGSSVLMAGVPIGTIDRIELLTESGTTVLHAKLLQKYPVRKGSQFVIRQSGFLGDQYIAVLLNPDKNSPIIKDGDTEHCEASFDFGEAAKTATGLLDRMNGMLGKISNVVDRIDNTLITSNVLISLGESVANLHAATDTAISVMNKVDRLLDTNGPAITGSVSNAQAFTAQLNVLAADLRKTLATNSEILTVSLSNIEKSSAKLDATMTDLNAGKGIAGALLRDEEIAQNLSLIVSNMQVLSSNMNNKGLWSVLKAPKTPAGKKK